ncbi:hypothetical protein ACQP2E_27025 [Actinoplanes sp. CA-015351]|uniref:hypothetical protein n=1 Tax=Actinoplanes sp. CA-015351 TaxID=3239897 RepID=UPI003D96725A
MISVVLAAVSVLIALAAVGALMAASVTLRRLPIAATERRPAIEPGAGPLVDLGQLDAAPAKRRRSWRVPIPLPLIAGLAVLLGVVGTYVTSMPGVKPEPVAVTPGPTTSRSVVEGAGRAVYTDRVLLLASCANSYLDLDGPRIEEEPTATLDLMIGTACGSADAALLLPSGVDGGVARSAEPTPQACRTAIRRNPIPPGKIRLIAKGETYCLITSLVRAAEEGISQKIVALVVTEIANGGGALRVSAWNTSI